MATDIKKLLNKRGWTGKEIGKALMASMLHDIKAQGKPHQPLFSQADLERMEDTLYKGSAGDSKAWDRLVYGVYKDMYSSVIDSFNRGQGLYQQFNNGYSSLLTHLFEMMHAEDAKEIIGRYPLIVTEDQYGRLKAKAGERLKARRESFSSLLFAILDAMLKAEPAELPKAIADALEAAKEEPAADKRYIALYSRTFGEGYYTLPDGRRSDRMTHEEWRAALEEQYISVHKLTVKEPADIWEEMKKFNQERMLRSYELLFKGADAIRAACREATGRELEGEDGEILGALEDIVRQTNRNSFSPAKEDIKQTLGYSPIPAEWHEAEEQPEGLTQHDLLPFYAEQGGIPRPAPADAKRPLQDLKKDFPALYEALAAYIEGCIPQARGLKTANPYKKFISRGELAELGVFGFRSLTTPRDTDIIEVFTEKDTAENYSKRARLYNGIAVIQSPYKSQLDENGNYIDPGNPLDYFESLDSVVENPDRMSEIKSFQSNLINPALSYLYAFNALMGIFGAAYDLPELGETAAFDTSFFERKIAAFNNLLYIFHADIHAQGEELKKKREQIKAIFTPLDADKLKPAQDAIDAVTADVKKMGYSTEARKKLKYLDNFIDRLMHGREEAL